MIEVTAGVTFSAVLSGAPTGQEGTVVARLVNASTEAIVASAIAVREVPNGSGVYVADFHAPVQGTYLVTWAVGATSVAEELRVYPPGTQLTPAPPVPPSTAPLTGQILAERACRVARRDPEEEEARDQALEWIGEGQATLLGTDDPWDFLERSGYLDLASGIDVIYLSDIADVFAIPPPGIERVLQLVPDSSGGLPLVPMYWQTQERAAATTQSSSAPGPPSSWAPIGPDRIRLWPRPVGGERLGALVRLAVPTQIGLTEEPMIPRPFQSEVLVSYGAMRMWEQWAGGDARLEAQRQGLRFETAVARLRAAHGVARTPNIMFSEPGYDDPQRFSPVGW